ncbi:MAG: DUF502 domain-containing protein [Planctomycetes bacterium]|nr:DUF502 domain-containing protein [Planctomycetota bacterium]
MGITRCLRNYFLRGLAVLLPTILTIGIFVWGYKFIQQNISIHINRGIVELIMFFQGDHEGVTRDAWQTVWVDGAGSIAGFAIALIAVCIVGALLASVVGKTLWRMIEKSIMSTPLLRQIYPYIKQVTDFLFTREEQKQLFSRVVAVEYPRKGIWSIGMVTGSGLKKVVDSTKKEILTIIIPTSPTPFTGFVIMVPKEQTIDLDLTMEEALRFIVSGGVIMPGNDQTVALPQADSADK